MSSILTAAQLTALKANLAANANTVSINGVPTAINAVPQGAQNAQTVADWYNLTASPDYFVWNSQVSVNDIFNNLTWANFTPAPAPDNTATWSNCSLSCQGKMLNLQTMLVGRSIFDATRLNLRAGLNDATTNLPSGTPVGTNKSGGWATILPILSRKCTNAEKVFAFDDGAGIGNTTTDPRGANTNPDSPGYDSLASGILTGSDILAAWAS